MVEYVVFALVIILATLNRETALFLVLAYGALVMATRRWHALPWLAVYAGLWLLTYFFILHQIGPGVRYWTLDRILLTNIEAFAPQSIWLLLALLGVWWLFAWQGLASSQGYLRVMLPVCALYVLTIVIWGHWYEVRLWLPILPVGLTGALLIYNKDRGSNENHP